MLHVLVVISSMVGPDKIVHDSLLLNRENEGISTGLVGCGMELKVKEGLDILEIRKRDGYPTK